MPRQWRRREIPPRSGPFLGREQQAAKRPWCRQRLKSRAVSRDHLVRTEKFLILHSPALLVAGKGPWAGCIRDLVHRCIPVCGPPLGWLDSRTAAFAARGPKLISCRERTG